MNKRTKETLIGTVAAVAIALSLYFGFGRNSSSINLGPYESLGAVTAEETAKLCGNQGHVLLMVHDMGGSRNPSVEAQISAFQQTLKRQKGMNVTIQKIQSTPMQMMATGGGVPPEPFMKALESHPNLTALVLFMGFPQLTDAELEQVHKTGIKTIVASPLRPGDRRLIQRQAIQVALVPKPDASPPNTPVPKTLRERFDQDFMIITPADVQ